LIRPVYPGVVEGDKVKICLPDMTCSSEINVFEIRAGQKAGLVQNCGISFISDRSKNVCLFSDFDSISDLNTSTCMYSLDGANWASADYNTFNTKHGCKVTISEILFGTHNVLFKMLKNDSNTVFSPSSKADINNSSINISCRYADCS
jgi:hypothetical protein